MNNKQKQTRKSKFVAFIIRPAVAVNAFVRAKHLVNNDIVDYVLHFLSVISFTFFINIFLIGGKQIGFYEIVLKSESMRISLLCCLISIALIFYKGHVAAKRCKESETKFYESVERLVNLFK